MAEKITTEEIMDWANATDVAPVIDAHSQATLAVALRTQRRRQVQVSRQRVSIIRSMVSGVLTEKRVEVVNAARTEVKTIDGLLMRMVQPSEQKPLTTSQKRRLRLEESPYDYGNLSPSTLPLHGMTYANSSSYATSAAGKRKFKSFRSFIRAVAPTIDNDVLAGKVVHKLLLADDPERGVPSELFDTTTEGIIHFRGTNGTTHSNQELIALTGSNLTGRATLDLFAGLSDPERVKSAIEEHNYISSH